MTEIKIISKPYFVKALYDKYWFQICSNKTIEIKKDSLLLCCKAEKINENGIKPMYSKCILVFNYNTIILFSFSDTVKDAFELKSMSKKYEYETLFEYWKRKGNKFGFKIIYH